MRVYDWVSWVVYEVSQELKASQLSMASVSEKESEESERGDRTETKSMSSSWTMSQVTMAAKKPLTFSTSSSYMASRQLG